MIPFALRDWLGWLHPAASGRGVVLCPPWGFEALCTRRSLLELAERLAAAGLPCLRLDLPGTGDSLDPPPGTPLLDRWIEALLEAAALLEQRTAVCEIAFVGLRLGALLVAEAAARADGVARLALLAPPRAGRTYLRELRAFARLAGGDPADHGSAAGPEALVAGGFALDAATLAALARLDPFARRAPPAARILVLERPDGAAVAAARRAWERAGATIEVEPFLGYAELVRDPLLSRPPRAAFARLVAFLAEGAPPGPAGRSAFPAAPGEALLVGPTFVERTLRFGPGERLIGTLTEPSAGETGTERPALLILNTGAVPRSGPGRTAVELARRLAAEGVRSLRLDLGGLGDSAAGPGEAAVDIYRRAALAEVRAAVDLLASFGSDEVVAMGVCSGAFMAFHAALGDPRLVGLVLVNLPRFSWRPFHPLVFVRTRTLLALLGQPASWWWAARGRGDLLAALRILAERLGARLAAHLPSGLRRIAATVSGPGRGLRTLLRRGVRLLVVYAADDPAWATRERLLDFARGPPGRSGLEVRVVEGASHTFSDPVSRPLLVELVRSHLDHYRRERRGSAPVHRAGRPAGRSPETIGPVARPAARAE